MCGLEIPTGSDACDKDGVETYRPAESATSLIAKAARPGNSAVCLTLDAQRSGIGPSCDRRRFDGTAARCDPANGANGAAADGESD
jgi:hypothetical protein